MKSGVSFTVSNLETRISKFRGFNSFMIIIQRSYENWAGTEGRR